MKWDVIFARAGFGATCLIAAMLGGFGISPAGAVVPPPAPTVFSDTRKLSQQIHELVVPFVVNAGEVDPRVAMFARTAGGTVYVGRDGDLTYGLKGATKSDAAMPSSAPRGWALKESFVGARVVHVRGIKPSGTRVRHLVAAAAPRLAAQRAYGEADLGEAWPGVHLAVRATGEYAEKFFYVAPGADAKRIRIDVDGASALAADSSGALIASTGVGAVRFTAPLAWQDIDGSRREVPVRYAMLGAHRYGFTLGAHDAAYEVVIDPIVQSTYIGGSSADQIFAMTVHPTTGDVYVTGQVESTTLFPVSAGAVDDTRAGLYDAFVARLPADLKSFTEVTYFGGAGNDAGSDVKIHPLNGDVYVAGTSFSAALPGTAGAAQPAGNTAGEPFVVRFTPDLQTIVRTTFYGHAGSLVSSEAFGLGISLVISPSSGMLFLSGSGHAAAIPNAAGGAIAAPSNYFGYITAIAADLASFGQGTYVCGTDSSSDTFVSALAIDSANDDLVVIGVTDSSALPVTPGAAISGYSSSQNRAPFIARFPKSLTSVKALTYYFDIGSVIFPYDVLVIGGDTVIGGSVNSISGAPMPGMVGGAIATPPPHTGNANNYGDGFIVKLSNDLTTIVQGTYIGGSNDDGVSAIGYNAATNEFYAAGVNFGQDIPALTGGADVAEAGAPGFISRLAPDLKSFVQSTFLGNVNGAVSIVVHPVNGDLYVAGWVNGNKAPNAAGGAQPTNQDTAGGGGLNGYITRLSASLQGSAPAGQLSFGSSAYQTNAGTTGFVVITRTSGNTGAVSVNVTTTDGTANAPADYTAVTTSVTFADGDSVAKSVPIPTTVRSSAQGNKTINVTLSSVTGGATLGGVSTAVLTIADATAPPPATLQFSASAYSAADNAGMALIGIKRSGGSAGAVTVAFQTSDGTAKAGTNYAATTRTVTFADGDSALKSVSVPIDVNGTVGSSYNVNLSLSAPTGGAILGVPATAILTINATTPVPVLNTVTVNGKGGGGTAGPLEVIFLGVLLLLNAWRRRTLQATLVLGGALLLGMLSSPAPALADSPGYYAGLGVGQVRSDASSTDAVRKLDAAGFPGATVSFDDRKFAAKFYAGISMNSYVALELAYVDLKTVRTRSSAVTADAAGFNAAVVAIHPY